MDTFFQVLKYGAIGLALGLAVLAYFLLKEEQGKEKPRPSILKAINRYMLFALVLFLGGFILEIIPFTRNANLPIVESQLSSNQLVALFNTGLYLGRAQLYVVHVDLNDEGLDTNLNQLREVAGDSNLFADVGVIDNIFKPRGANPATEMVQRLGNAELELIGQLKGRK